MRVRKRPWAGVVVIGVAAVLATFVGVAVAHEDPGDPDHESAHATAEELGETVEATWPATGPAGRSYTIQVVTIPAMWDRVGHNLLTADGERLYGVWDAPACVGQEPGSFRLHEVAGGFDIVGSTRDGATAVELGFADGSVQTVQTFAAAQVPLSFFRTTVPDRPTSLEPIGVDDAPPCVQNQVEGR